MPASAQRSREEKPLSVSFDVNGVHCMHGLCPGQSRPSNRLLQDEGLISRQTLWRSMDGYVLPCRHQGSAFGVLCFERQACHLVRLDKDIRSICSDAPTICGITGPDDDHGQYCL